MPNAPSFVAHALDLLAPLGPVQARSMFGAHGFYLRGVMLALLDDDELFFKTDELSRPAFVDARCRMWVYPGMEQTSYYRPPDEAHEDPEAMLPWARRGLEAALRLKALKDRAAAEKAARRAARMKASAKAPAKGVAKARSTPKGAAARKRSKSRRSTGPREAKRRTPAR
jgi:DNA transformation protein